MRRAAFLLLAALLLGLRPAATPIASPLPSEAPGVHRIVVAQFVAWQAGVLDRSKYGTEFNAQISDAHVKKVSSELDALGAFESAEYLGPTTVPNSPAGISSYVYRMICENGAVYVRISLSPSGRVGGILFADLPSGLIAK